MVKAPPAPGDISLKATKLDPLPTNIVAQPFRESPARPATEDKRKAYVILGRHGDIVNVLPVFREEAIATERPVNVVVSRECSSVFHGVTYVNPYPVDIGVHRLSEGESIARKQFEIVQSVQVWGDGRPRIQSMRHYNQDAWVLAGKWADFKRADLRPVFNVRSPAREAALSKMFIQGEKPVILIASDGGFSSPFQGHERVQRAICDSFGSQYEILNLCRIKTQEVYDLIGLMDRASVLVTADSVHLHLAAASNIPVVAMTSYKGTWAESEPRCRTVWCGNYQTALRSVGQIIDAIRPCVDRPAVGPRIIQVTDDFAFSQIGAVRHQKAFVSWIRDKDLLSHHLHEPYPRSSLSIGSKRRLPYLKDVLLCGLDHARPQDIVVWTNSDTILVPGLVQLIQKTIDVTPITTARRIDFATARKHPGRDLVAFRAKWLKDHWLDIPDFICGTADLDNWMAFAARREIGRPTTARQLFDDWYPADLPPGSIKHMAHGTPEWDRADNRYAEPGNRYNVGILRAWCQQFMPSVHFRPDGFINWDK